MSDAVAAPVASATPADERFLAAVRGQLAEAAVDLRNEEISVIGGQACASLAAGHPRKAVAAEVTEYGLPAAEARQLVGLARRTLCESEAEAAGESAGEAAGGDVDPSDSADPNGSVDESGNTDESSSGG
ncbi:DUF732 domain-containing protein [Actinoplanes sp. CA-252034]|uniref:DUF732 domain-containing protein n=1 Tax=Actinoplanes sp. CA-252034 TaxID=3239906 RepID=UPI003D96852B